MKIFSFVVLAILVGLVAVNDVESVPPNCAPANMMRSKLDADKKTINRDDLIGGRSLQSTSSYRIRNLQPIVIGSITDKPVSFCQTMVQRMTRDYELSSAVQSSLKSICYTNKKGAAWVTIPATFTRYPDKFIMGRVLVENDLQLMKWTVAIYKADFKINSGLCPMRTRWSVAYLKNEALDKLTNKFKQLCQV